MSTMRHIMYFFSAHGPLAMGLGVSRPGPGMGPGPRALDRDHDLDHDLDRDHDLDHDLDHDEDEGEDEKGVEHVEQVGNAFKILKMLKTRSIC